MTLAALIEAYAGYERRALLLYRRLAERFAADGAAVLERMNALAGPARRLVVTGGWAAGEGARAVKRRRLGPFDHVPGLWAGARGAALAAAMAAGLEVS